MALPLILYDLAPVLNPSFETDAGGVKPPTNWTTNAGASDAATVDTALPFVRGSNEGSKNVRTERFNGLSPNPVYVRQDMSFSPVDGVKVMLVGMIRTGGFLNQSAVKAELDELNGSTVLAATNITVDDLGIGNLGMTWKPFHATRSLDQATRDGMRVQLGIGQTGGSVFYDYVHLGRAVDFTEQEFVRVQILSGDRAALNVAPGAWEGVKVGNPVTRVQVTMDHILVGSDVDLALKAFRGKAQAHQRFAFWIDRFDNTNEGRHFSECILAPGTLPEKIPPGTFSYSTVMDFIAPIEWQAQEVT